MSLIPKWGQYLHRHALIHPSAQFLMSCHRYGGVAPVSRAVSTLTTRDRPTLISARRVSGREGLHPEEALVFLAWQFIAKSVQVG